MSETVCIENVPLFKTADQALERYRSAFTRMHVIYERRMFGAMCTIVINKPTYNSDSSHRGTSLVVILLQATDRPFRTVCITSKYIYSIAGVKSHLLTYRFEHSNTRARIEMFLTLANAW